VAGCCECGDEPSGSCATELVADQDGTETCGHPAQSNNLALLQTDIL
jgi:hypothetical protein